MLILSRRIGETICIGNDVQILVLSIKGNQVRLGVRAPKSVSVHREEVYRRIELELELGAMPPIKQRSASHAKPKTP